MERACLFIGLGGFLLLGLAIGDGHHLDQPWPLLIGLPLAAAALYGGLSLRLQRLLLQAERGRRAAQGDDLGRPVVRIR